MDTPPISSLPRTNCSTCRQPKLVAFQTFKNCADCREKNREKDRKINLRAAERKLERQQAERAMLAQRANLNLPDSDSDTKVIVQEQRTSTGAVKRKTPLATHGLNVDVARKRSKGVLMKSGLRNRDLAPAPFNSNAYQSASLMYGALHDEMCERMNFNGHHSIVTMSDVNNPQRVDMVQKDLHKIVRLPFDHKHAVKQRDSGFSLRFKCMCLGQLGDAPRECGGKVTITARADGSHPLVPGQAISVSVTH